MNKTITFEDMRSILARREFTIDMAVFFLVCVPCVVVALYFIRKLDALLGFSPFVGFPYNVLLGVILAVTGALIIWRAYTYLVIVGEGSPCPQIGGTKKIVTVGPYALVRHPSVIGKLCGIVGLGCLSGSVTFTFILIPLLMTWSAFYNRFIQERVCVERFGEEYLAYRRAVPMFIPRPSALWRRMRRCA